MMSCEEYQYREPRTPCGMVILLKAYHPSPSFHRFGLSPACSHMLSSNPRLSRLPVLLNPGVHRLRPSAYHLSKSPMRLTLSCINYLFSPSRTYAQVMGATDS